MPYDQVMHKFKHGELHSGSKSGPPVKNRAQAIAIMMSEKRKAEGGKTEYQSKKMQGGGLVEPKEYKKGGYVGFAAVEASARKSGARNPAAVAASVGRKKYGKSKFQKAAAQGKKMRGFSSIGR